MLARNSPVVVSIGAPLGGLHSGRAGVRAALLLSQALSCWPHLILIEAV